ncbi:hypothetical protein RclHR1_06650003 [Rhizophagus clarus]|uniref:Uncharacterized protein n=1 Tax=Rhizophagus clarus TaxID=94130 RepID=A0A2Z6RYV7_9GLOM|nr:hypothetical protein RclHR1_06650003 [Rhizophagus clarus]
MVTVMMLKVMLEQMFDVAFSEEWFFRNPWRQYDHNTPKQSFRMHMESYYEAVLPWDADRDLDIPEQNSLRPCPVFFLSPDILSALKPGILFVNPDQGIFNFRS